jgi:hypothetical protein
LGEFGARRDDPRCGEGVDSEFVVAAAQILHEGAGDHDCGAAPRSTPAAIGAGFRAYDHAGRFSEVPAAFITGAVLGLSRVDIVHRVGVTPKA